MPFDNSLVLLDGSIDLTAALDTPAVSTTRSATTGAAIIDIRKTGNHGLVAVLICFDSAVAAADTLTAFIETSGSATFASDVHEVGKFDKAAATKGVILGSEVPDIFYVYFKTNERYVRLNATVGADPDGFNTVYCFLTPYPFDYL